MGLYGQATIDGCLRECARIMELVEEDQREMARCLGGEPLEAYRELTDAELDILGDCRRLMAGGGG